MNIFFFNSFFLCFMRFWSFYFKFNFNWFGGFTLPPSLSCSTTKKTFFMCVFYVPAVPRKLFVSADCDTIYLSLHQNQLTLTLFVAHIVGYQCSILFQFWVLSWVVGMVFMSNGTMYLQNSFCNQCVLK